MSQKVLGKVLTRAQAHQEANRRWGTSGIAPGDRYGIVVVRQKKVVDRFEVGYAIRGGRTEGGTLLHRQQLMGKGPSWEEALARAAHKCIHCGLTRSEAAGSPVLCIDRGTHDFGAADKPREPLIVQVPTLLSIANDREQSAAASITDDQIREVIAATLALGKGKRQNAHVRSLRKDCEAALGGSSFCRAHVAEFIAEHGGRDYHGAAIPRKR